MKALHLKNVLIAVNLAQIGMDIEGNGSMDSTEPLTLLTGHDEENPHHQKKWHLVCFFDMFLSSGNILKMFDKLLTSDKSLMSVNYY